MEIEEFFKQLVHTNESKCSVKIEQNSKGHNVTVHVYAGVTKEEIDETVKQAVYAHKLTTGKLE